MVAVLMLDIQWVQCTTGTWCELARLDLSTVLEEGVYVIWVGGGRTIRVGQGNVD